MGALKICFFLLVAVSLSVNICGGVPLSKNSLKVVQVSQNIKNKDILDVDDYDGLDLDADEEETDYDDREIDLELINKGDDSRLNMPLKFPKFKNQGKYNRELNKKMALKIASIIEQAALLAANDVLQTVALLQTDPEDFLASNSSGSS